MRLLYNRLVWVWLLDHDPQQGIVDPRLAAEDVETDIGGVRRTASEEKQWAIGCLDSDARRM